MKNTIILFSISRLAYWGYSRNSFTRSIYVGWLRNEQKIRQFNTVFSRKKKKKKMDSSKRKMICRCFCCRHSTTSCLLMDRVLRFINSIYQFYKNSFHLRQNVNHAIQWCNECSRKNIKVEIRKQKRRGIKQLDSVIRLIKKHD